MHTRRALILGCLVTAGLALSLSVVYGAGDDDGFRSIFDGKTLEGWHAPDMSYWSVEDGCITGKSTDQHPCTENQFLSWTQGQVDDFELRCKFRIAGRDDANSGIQFRSATKPNGHVFGYQADIDRGGQYVATLYDELGRGGLANRGQKVVIAPDGKRTIENFGDAAELYKKFKKDDWNDYTVRAEGGHITLTLNGTKTVDIVDDETKERDLVGVMALQLHSGAATTVQFKDVMLKRLPLSDGRKKIVMIAGHPSHGPGEHEFNAGIALLKKCLDGTPTVLAAEYHDNGWPKDPTAFDNANAVVIYADGGGGHPINAHLDEVEALTKKGVGLMCMHYAVEVPKDPAGKDFLQWIGGFYEDGVSTNPTWSYPAELQKDTPITRGVESFETKDEWYFNIHFRPDMQGVTSILRGTPSDETRQGATSWPRGPHKHIVDAKGRVETMMWAVQRPDGGRGVGFTGGHYHANWGNDNVRKLVLNGIVWVSGAEVPEGGVKSSVTPEELKANLDKK